MERLVIINGVPQSINADYLSYARAVQLAFPKRKTGSIMTVTWCLVDQGGSVVPGGSIKLHHHLIINVSDTSGA